MKNIKISVAMATFNGEKYLDQQLQSILNQDRIPDELIICDDCSCDNTYQILENFKNNCKFEVKIIRNTKNLGVGKNFEKAVLNCTGDIVLFSDQDDYWESNKLSLSEKMFLKNPQIDFAISDADIVDRKLKSLGYTLWEQRKFSKNLQKKFENGNEFDVLIRREIHTGMTLAIKKDLIKKLSPIPDDINHDAWYIPLAAALGKKGKLIKNTLVKYRQHNIQLYGASKNSAIVKIDRFLNSNNDLYKKKIILYKNYLNYPGLDNKIILKLNNIISHYEHKIRISKSCRYQRLFKIFKEVVNLNYIKYGNFNSFIFDMLRNRIEK